MSDVLPEDANQPISRLERVAPRAFEVGAIAGPAAVGGFFGYLAGESLSPEGQNILGAVLEKSVEGVGVLGGAGVAGVIGFVLSVRAAINGYRE